MADDGRLPPSPFLTVSQRRDRAGSVISHQSQTSHASEAFPFPSNPDQGPSIRIRRTSNASTVGSSRNVNQASQQADLEAQNAGVRRHRSISEPHRGQVPAAPRLNTQVPYMPRMSEEITSPEGTAIRANILDVPPTLPEDGARPTSSGTEAADFATPRSSWRPLRKARSSILQTRPSMVSQDEYDNNLVDLLDLVDPEVATLQTLTNVQNSLFVPSLGKYLNRRPTYNLTRRPSDEGEATTSSDDAEEQVRIRPQSQRTETAATINTISSNVNDRYYAVLPHGVSLSGWSEEDKWELNDHVRHMLHSKRSAFKRSMKGFRQYVKRPLGFFVTVYATLITLFGLIWVLFLIGWIGLGSRKDYIVNIIDNILVTLFAIMGDGLAPFRAVDTYHMCFIAHYHHLTWRLRREKALPKLQNKNDLPTVYLDDVPNPEEAEVSVLSPEQQRKLAHHQKKFNRSHSFYKPHETYTHHAFPLRLLVAIVVLLDCHSLLQISLGACTWGISYHVRPFALTTVILCCSITCNITAGVLITVGDHKTRKKDVKEKLFRQELTAEALKKVEKKKRKEKAAEKEAMGLNPDDEAPENAVHANAEKALEGTPAASRISTQEEIPRMMVGGLSAIKSEDTDVGGLSTIPSSTLGAMSSKSDNVYATDLKKDEMI